LDPDFESAYPISISLKNSFLSSYYSNFGRYIPMFYASDTSKCVTISFHFLAQFLMFSHLLFLHTPMPTALITLAPYSHEIILCSFEIRAIYRDVLSLIERSTLVISL
jgi:hypothetical protein